MEVKAVELFETVGSRKLAGQVSVVPGVLHQDEHMCRLAFHDTVVLQARDKVD